MVTDIRQRLVGEHPSLALGTVVAVGGATAALLVPFGLLEVGMSGVIGTSAVALAFGGVPFVAGGLSGWCRLGVLTAVGSGIAPGGTFYLVVAIGAALGIGSFGGGDSPLGPFALTVTIPSLGAAAVGFILPVVARRVHGFGS